MYESGLGLFKSLVFSLSKTWENLSLLFIQKLSFDLLDFLKDLCCDLRVPSYVNSFRSESKAILDPGKKVSTQRITNYHIRLSNQAVHGHIYEW